ncbi:MAG: NAD(P)-dependent oxidoreductase [Bdellovibrionales bacterium]
MKVLALESYSVSALARLQGQGGFAVTQDEKEIATADALLIRSHVRVDRELLDRAPQLKLVVTATSGFDHIDWRECERRSVTAAFTPEANAQSTAELTWALILAAERNLFGATRFVRDNQWREGLPRPHGLEGKTLGVIGLGRVGGRVARLAHAFGMNTIAHDPYVDTDVFTHFGIERSGLIEVLRTSDYVSLHVPLTRETRHLLNQPTLAEMQADAILINTCRGPVVDQNDLLAALDDGRIAGAAMDVIEREPPPPGHRLRTHPRLILTPHIGAFTESAWVKASQDAVEKVIQFQRGEKLLDTLPLQTAWFAKT